MTKAARIMELAKFGLSTREIADVIGCRTEYVRVVTRQRKGYGTSDIDRRYVQSPKGRQQAEKYYPRKLERQNERYATDPAFRKKRRESWRHWYWERGGREWTRNYDKTRRAEARAS